MLIGYISLTVIAKKEEEEKQVRKGAVKVRTVEPLMCEWKLIHWALNDCFWGKTFCVSN